MEAADNHIRRNRIKRINKRYKTVNENYRDKKKGIQD